jgi:hypothetical protein
VNLGGEMFSHVVSSATTKEQLATALAALIDASSNYVASANGSSITVSGAALSAAGSVASSVGGLGEVTVTRGAKTNAPTVVVLSELAAVSGVTYTLTAGAQTASVTATGTDIATLASQLATALSTAPNTTVASSRAVTVGATWAAVLAELDSQIEAGELISVDVVAANAKLTLTSTDSNKAFTIDAIGVDLNDRFSAIGSNAQVLAASTVKQVTELSMSAGASVATGDTYTLVLTDSSDIVRSYQVAANYRVDTPVAQPTGITTRAASSSLSQIDTLSLGSVDEGVTYRVFLTSAVVNTAAANSALYVGTMRASANGQTEMSLGAPTPAVGGTANKLYLWNAYQRVPTSATCRESTDTWTYTTAAWQAKNASASNAINYVSGLAEGTVRASASAFTSSDTSGIRRINGIGLNSTTAIASGCITGYIDTQAARVAQGVATYAAPAALGLSTLTELEQSVATGVSTWYGDGGGASLIQTGMTVELMM